MKKMAKKTAMKTAAGIKVTTGVKAGGFDPTGRMGGNHSRNTLKVKAGLRAGTVIQLANHNRRVQTPTKAGIKVTTGVKAGGFDPTGRMGGNHSRNTLKVKAGLRAGTVIQLANHNRRVQTTTKAAGIKVTTGVKAGGFDPTGRMGGNHSRNTLKVKAGLRAGTVIQLANHNHRVFTLV